MDFTKLLLIRFGVALLFTQEVCVSDTSGYIGCYNDKVGITIDDATGYKILKKNAPVSQCIMLCRDSLKIYAGAKYHSDDMKCYCGDVLKNVSPTKKADCNEVCPGSGKKECAGSGKITLYRIRYKTSSSAALPIVLTTILVVIVAVVIVIIVKWRRYFRDKIKQLQIRKVSVAANNECSGFQTLPSTSTSDYSTIQDPYNYIDIPIEGSLDKPSRDDNYSKIKPTGQYDCVHSPPQLSSCNNSNYNHINVDEFGSGSENNYSCTAKGHKSNSTRNKSDGTYNKLVEDVPISAISECSNDPEYDHLRANPCGTKATPSDNKEYSHLATIEKRQ